MKTRAGMTLLEVIVALTVAGAALAAGAAVLGFLTDQQGRSGAQAVASANAVRTTLRDWVTNAQLTTQGDAEFRGAPMKSNSSDLDADADVEMSFVTSAPTEIALGGTLVHLYVQHDRSAPIHGLVAELRPWRRDGAPVNLSLAPDATGLRARYLPSAFATRTWQRSWISSNVLPAAVEIRVQFDAPRSSDPTDRAAHALLAMPMTIPLGGRR